MSHKPGILLTTILSGGAAAAVSPPAQPTGLTATPVSTSQIDLAWTDVATTETAYKVYRSTDGSTYAQVGTDLAAGTQAYSDATITAGTKYWYKVAAVNAGGETLSTAVTATTLTYGLRSYWKCEETTGTRVDAIGNNNLAGSGGSPNSGTGIIGNGALGEGANYLVKSTGISDNLQTAGVSCWGWVFVTSFTGRKGILQNSNSSDMSLTVESATQILFTITDSSSGSSNASKGSLSLQTNTWYFVWGRYDPATKKAEVGYNAVAGSLGSALTNGAKTITRLEIARGAGTVMNTAITDEIGYMLRMLTAGELTALYNSGVGVTHPF